MVRHFEWHSSSPSFFLHILIPILLPSLFLPLLYLLHSLTNAKFRWRESLLLLFPATPILLHLLLIVRRCQGHVVTRLDHAGRVAGMVQTTLMSGPLILVSLVTAMKATVLLEDEKVDIGEMDKHFYEYGIQVS